MREHLALGYNYQSKGELYSVSNFTRKAIKDTFLKLLDEKPLNEITVKNIVEECGINRNSFYYHFQDLPSLIEEIIKEESDSVIQKYSSVNTIVECFDAITEFATNRRRAIMHIYRSVSRDVFEQYLMKTSQYFVQSYLDTALADENISTEDKNAIINYYKCVCFGLVIDWLNNGLKEEYSQAFKKIFKLKIDMAVDIAQKLKKQI